MANFQLQDTQQVPYQIVVIDADGNPAGPLDPASTLLVSSSDTTMATVVPDATPVVGPGVVASGNILGASVLGTVQISAQETHGDGSAGFNGNVMIDVVGGAAALLEVNLGTPVPQAAGTTPPPGGGPAPAPVKH